MLEYMQFMTGGLHGYTTVGVRNVDGIVVVTVDSMLYPTGNGTKTLSQQESAEWLKALKRIRIGSWNDEYSDSDILDGHQWSLEYKVVGKRCRLICGSNAYPENFRVFEEFMDRIAPIYPPDEIMFLSLRYWKGREGADAVDGEPDESIVLDRKDETLMMRQRVGHLFTATRSYSSKVFIDELLDSLEGYRNYLPEGTSAIGASIAPVYEMTIRYRKDKERRFRGTFNRIGIPEAWEMWAEDIAEFVRMYECSFDVLNENVYLHGAKPGEYTYLSVSFQPYSKTYYYQTSDQKLKVGDYVIVPAGINNVEKMVKIDKIEYFKEDALPMPLDKVKFILRKADA